MIEYYREFVDDTYDGTGAISSERLGVLAENGWLLCAVEQCNQRYGEDVCSPFETDFKKLYTFYKHKNTVKK